MKLRPALGEAGAPRQEASDAPERQARAVHAALAYLASLRAPSCQSMRCVVTLGTGGVGLLVLGHQSSEPVAASCLKGACVYFSILSAAVFTSCAQMLCLGW